MMTAEPGVSRQTHTLFAVIVFAGIRCNSNLTITLCSLRTSPHP